MKRGEKVILISIVIVVLALMGRNLWHIEEGHDVDRGIPYYSTASAQLTSDAMAIYHQQGCKNCHSLWTVRNPLETVPAPILDGIGSLRTEEWLYKYFSSPSPQGILPSRLKAEYRMPSFSNISDHDRQLLAQYMASLKVKDWYLEETRKAEYEKLTGKKYGNE